MRSAAVSEPGGEVVHAEFPEEGEVAPSTLALRVSCMP